MSTGSGNVSGYDARWPDSIEAIASWTEQNEREPLDGWRRYAQKIALRCLATDPSTSDSLAVHGGASIAYAFGGPRTPKDIDLLVLNVSNSEAAADEFRNAVMSKISAALSRQMRAMVPNFNEHRDRFRELIKIDLFVSEFSVPLTEFSIGSNLKRLVFLTTGLEATVARKYLALLRTRGERQKNLYQDVFDLAWIINAYAAHINRREVARLFHNEAGQAFWYTSPNSNDLFTHELRHQASTGYESLKGKIGTHFVPFERAWVAIRDYYEQWPVHGNSEII